jgi:hypothetical protein
MMGKIIRYVLTSLLLAGYSSFALAIVVPEGCEYVCEGSACSIECPTASVTEPETILLFGIGLAAIGVMQRWRRRK